MLMFILLLMMMKRSGSRSKPLVERQAEARVDQEKEAGKGAETCRRRC